MHDWAARGHWVRICARRTRRRAGQPARGLGPKKARPGAADPPLKRLVLAEPQAFLLPPSEVRMLGEMDCSCRWPAFCLAGAHRCRPGRRSARAISGPGGTESSRSNFSSSGRWGDGYLPVTTTSATGGRVPSHQRGRFPGPLQPRLRAESSGPHQDRRAHLIGREARAASGRAQASGDSLQLIVSTPPSTTWLRPGTRAWRRSPTADGNGAILSS